MHFSNQEVAHVMAFAQSTTQYIPASNTDEATRSAFLVRVYQHVALAVLAFVAFETVLFVTGIADFMLDTFGGSNLLWLLLIGLMWLGGTMSANAALRVDNPNLQYAGLFGQAGIYSFVFAPLLKVVADSDGGSGILIQAAGITLVGFAGLTVIGMTTSKDLSFLRPMVMWGGFVALGLIVAALLFGLSLGIWFSVGMIALSGVSILYQTQKVVRQFPAWAHVAAALGLFSSLMTMFYYVVRLLAQMRR